MSQISKKNLNKSPLIDKTVKIQLHKLKCKQVMSKEFRSLHKLKHSSIALTCRQLMNSEKRARLNAKNSLSVSMSPEQKKTNSTLSNITEISATHAKQGVIKSNLNIESSNDNKEVSSISITTTSGIHSIVTRAVKIPKRHSTHRRKSSDSFSKETSINGAESPSDINCSKMKENESSKILSLPMEINKQNEDSQCKQLKEEKIVSENKSSQKRTIALDNNNEIKNKSDISISDSVNINKEAKSLIVSDDIQTPEIIEILPNISSVQSVPKIRKVESAPKINKVQSVPIISQVQSVPIISQVQSVPIINQVELVPIISQDLSVPIISDVQSVPIISDVQSVNESTEIKDDIGKKCVQTLINTVTTPFKDNIEINSQKHLVTNNSPSTTILRNTEDESAIINKSVSNIDNEVNVVQYNLSPTIVNAVQEVTVPHTEEKIKSPKIKDSLIISNVESLSNDNSECSNSEDTISAISSESDDCLIIEKVESISQANADALIKNESDMHWDNDILPTNFLQCDMLVSEPDSENKNEDIKLNSKPVVNVKKLSWKDLDNNFMLTQGVNLCSQLYCRMELKRFEKRAKLKHEKDEKLVNILKNIRNPIKSKNLYSWRKSLSDILSKDKPSRAPNTIIHNIPTITKESPIKIINPNISNINAILIDVESDCLSSEMSSKKHNPVILTTIPAISETGFTPRETYASKIMNLQNKSYIRPKPLSLLMPTADESIVPNSNQSATAIPPMNNSQTHTTLNSSVNKNLQSKPYITNIAPKNIQPSDMIMNIQSVCPTKPGETTPFVENYSFSHSIFGSLMEKDTISNTTPQTMPIIYPTAYVPPMVQQPPTAQSAAPIVQLPPPTPQSAPPIVQIPPPPPQYGSPIVQQPPPQYSAAYNQSAHNSREMMPLPLQSSVVMRNQIPMSVYNNQVLPNLNSHVIPINTAPILQKPYVYPPSNSVQFERPMILLQQPFIPVLGGGIIRKERIEEQYNSVPMYCIGKHNISHNLIEKVSNLLKNMKEIGYPDSTYSLQHTAYQLLVSIGACCLQEAISVVNSKRFRSMMFIPESAPPYTRPTVPVVEKVVLKFYPGYQMFIFKKFTFAVDIGTREVIYPMPPFCFPRNSPVVDKITVIILLSPREGLGPGLFVLPHTILSHNLRHSLSNEPALEEWGLSAHNSGGLTRTIVHDYLTKVALPWLNKVKSKQWENYLLVDKWWALDKLSIPPEYSGFLTFGLHQMYKTNYDPLDVFLNMTLQRLWGVFVRKWVLVNGPLTEDKFPKFFIQSMQNLYSNSKIADFCAQTGLYPIDMSRAQHFTQQDFSY